MAIVYIALGANMGDRAASIAAAAAELKQNGVQVLKSSSVIETKPYGLTDQPDFLNCVLKCETELSPRELLNTTLRIEEAMGRLRILKWGPRKIDIDIIFYGGQIISEPDLVVPHPDMQNREFVLGPLCEIEPELCHPAFNLTVTELHWRLLTLSRSRPPDK